MCEMMSKGSKEALTVLIDTHVTHVEKVERLCYVETRDKHIFAHNFLNNQLIFHPQKVLESWDLDLSNHTIQYQPLQHVSTYIALDGMVGKV